MTANEAPNEAATAACTKATGSDFVAADPTAGMTRQLAVRTEMMWSGLVDTDPGAVSGWHHHGEHETTLYVLAGRMRLDFGPGGEQHVDAGPGDFIHVPAGAVHRESNPGQTPARAVIVRCGTGEPTVNVEGPVQV